MDQTARFALPFLAPGQMQKELFHNEALQTVDMLLCPAVDGPPLVTPPGNPAAGNSYIVGVAATGAWTGRDGSIACFTDSGWRFAGPVDGMALTDRLTGQTWTRRNGIWETGIVRAQELRVDGVAVVRGRQPGIADPTAGSIVDSECRAVVAQILAALRGHGLIG